MTNSNKKLNFHFLFSTFFGLGKTGKRFSILAASIVAIPIAYLLLFASTILLNNSDFNSPFYSLALSVFMVAILTAIAIYSAGTYARQIKIKDPNEVVIDEILGQCLCVILTVPLTFPLVLLSKLSQRFQIPDLAILGSSLILNIFLFRIFDSLKPWPINVIEKCKGGFGIILDDIVAGFFAAVTYYAILLAIISFA